MAKPNDYAIVTRVRVRSGHIDHVAKLFRDNNPALVATQPNWKSARMLADRENNSVTVVAIWSDPDAYRRFSEGPLREAMKAFMPHLEGPPEISVHEVLVDM